MADSCPAGKPLFLRVSITDRCQLRCQYCRPAEGIDLRPKADILRYEEMLEAVSCLHSTFGLAKVRLTGGDPLVRLGIDRLVHDLSVLGVPDLALTTNGQRLAQFAPALKAAGLTRVNISLDSLNAETYRGLSRGGVLQKALEGIEEALRQNLTPVKLNAVVLKGINDGEVAELLAFALEHDCELRFLELMPIGVAAPGFDARFVPSRAVQARLAERYTLTPLRSEPGATSRRFRADDTATGRSGVVGFIAPCSHPFCEGCRRLRLTSDGHLLGCLAAGEPLNIRPLLNRGAADPEAWKAVVEQALSQKRTAPAFERMRPMTSVGG